VAVDPMTPSPMAAPAAARPEAAIPAVALVGVVKRFGDIAAVAGVDLEQRIAGDATAVR